MTMEGAECQLRTLQFLFHTHHRPRYGRMAVGLVGFVGARVSYLDIEIEGSERDTRTAATILSTSEVGDKARAKVVRPLKIERGRCRKVGRNSSDPGCEGNDQKRRRRGGVDQV